MFYNLNGTWKKDFIFKNFGQPLKYDEIGFECYKVIAPIGEGRNHKAYP